MATEAAGLERWAAGRTAARGLGWWALGIGLALPGAWAAGHYPLHAAMAAAAVTALLAAGLLVWNNPAWGACALILIIYWNASDVVTDAFGFSWVLRLAMAAAIGAGVWNGLIASDRRRLRWPLLWPFLAYGVVQTLAVAGALDRAAAVGQVAEWGRAAVVFYLVANLLRTPRALRWGVNALLLAVVLLSVPVIYQGLSGSHNQFWGFGSMVYKEIVPGEMGWRLGGAMGDPNFLAMVLVASLPLGIMQALESGAGWRRWWGLLAAAAALGATLFTYSRASLFGVALVVGVLGWKHRKRRLVWAGAAAALAGAMALMPATFFGRLASLTEISSVRTTELPDASFQIRLNADLAGALMLEQHPLLGVGPGNYPANYMQYSTEVGLASDPTQRDPHNLYIQVASETGLLGMLAFGWLLWAAFALMERGRRRLRRLGAEHFADWVWALELAVATYLVLSIFLHGAYFRHFLLLVALGTLAATMATEGEEEGAAIGTARRVWKGAGGAKAAKLRAG